MNVCMSLVTLLNQNNDERKRYKTLKCVTSMKNKRKDIELLDKTKKKHAPSIPTIL